jgi:leader peptidase (prepilin peptidase)/N-methyltransferase
LSVIDAAGSLGIFAAVLFGVAYLWLGAVSIALTAIDLETHRLPNTLVLPGYGIAFLALGVPALLAQDFGRVAIMAAGAVILFGFYLLLALAWPGGMGLGDVKLAGVLGAFLGFSGWAALAVGAFGAFLLGGLLSVILLATRVVNRKSGIPFGPWMIAGAWLGLVVGDPVAAGYLSLFALAK